MGRTPSRKNLSYWHDGNHDWVSIADLGSFGKYVGSTKERINNLAIAETGIKPAPANTVLMSFKLSLGKTAITTAPVYTNEAIMAFVDKGVYPVDSSFMYHQCRAKDWTANTNTAVMGKTLNKKTLSQQMIVLPGLKEQKAIARQLDFVECQLDNANEQLSHLDTLVKSQFVEMFERGQRWELRALAECCTTPDDIKCGPFGSQLHKEDYISEGVPVWGIPEVNANFRRMPDKYVSLENGQRLQSYSLAPGDVAMNRKGNVGQAALFDGKKPSGIIHSDVLRVRVDQDVLSPAFLVEQFHSSHVVREQIVFASTGAIMAGTNVTKLKKIKVFVPPLALQQEFADFVVQVDKSRFVACFGWGVG